MSYAQHTLALIEQYLSHSGPPILQTMPGVLTFYICLTWKYQLTYRTEKDDQEQKVI